MNKHKMPMDEKLFELMYELIDIEEIEKEGYRNMVDISVEGNQTYLLGNGILSHNSASNSISKILGRQGNGFYAMFGVPPNAYDMDLKDIISSKKMIDLQQILGLQFSKTTQENINFKNIIITTDFDLPGHFIAGQLFGLFFRFGKNLFNEGRIKRLITPLIVVKDSKEKIVTWFYSFEDYREFEEKNHDKKYNYDYKKGLGSWSQTELELVIEKDGLNNMLEVMNIEDAETLIDDWLSDKKADRRKEMLEGYEFNIMNL